MRQTVLFRNLAAGVAALALFAGLSGSVRADEAYGFSIQGIAGLRFNLTGGATIDVAGALVAASATNSASLTGSPSVSQPGSTDALQAFVGPGLTAPAENFGARFSGLQLSAGGLTGTDGDAFANFAVGSPLPAGSLPTGEKTGQPPLSFARGDMLIVGALSNLFNSTGINAYNVAEAYARNVGQGSSPTITASASGGYTITAVFTALTSGSLGLVANGGYSNSVYAAVNPNTFGNITTSTAAFKTDFTLNNLTSGGVAQGASPPHLNHTQSAAFNIAETLDTGPDINASEGASPGTLPFSITAGQRYQLQISIVESTQVTAGIPEPGPVALAALGGLMVAAGGLRHRLARRNKVEA